jgi:DNA-binding transcriptional LysR family regulator
MSQSVDLRHLRYFVAVAEELSFTAAARRLGMAQPPLSQQIRRLEEAVGSQLLARVPRVALTEAGTVFLEAARRTLVQMALAIDAAGRVGRGLSGRLTVGVASSVVFTPLARGFRAYAARYPDVEFQLREMHSGAQLAALRSGTIDVGLPRRRARASTRRSPPTARSTSSRRWPAVRSYSDPNSPRPSHTPSP